jgi:hypothetical protein
MATQLTAKEFFNSQGTWFIPQIANNYPQYASNGARGISWGGAFSKDFALYLRASQTVNANFRDFSRFRILIQSAIVNRIGYQVIFDPVSFIGGDYEFSTDSQGGVVIGEPGSPWDVFSQFGMGQYTTEDITSVDNLQGQVEPPFEFAWAVDGDGNFAYYYDGTWYTSGGALPLELYFFFDGKGFSSLDEYYRGVRFTDGNEALNGNFPWTAQYLIPA